MVIAIQMLKVVTKLTIVIPNNAVCKVAIALTGSIKRIKTNAEYYTGTAVIMTLYTGNESVVFYLSSKVVMFRQLTILFL